jgi:hypothetical protein
MEERALKLGDRWFGLLGTMIASIATLVSGFAGYILGRSDFRYRDTIRELLSQLSMRDPPAKRGLCKFAWCRRYAFR